MLQLYWGDGKGKTTAAMGLALRALGHGRRVVILQFLKDGSSGEIEMLRRCGAVVYACPNAKFTWLMTDAERAEARRTNTRTLQTFLQGSVDLLVLDDACAATGCTYDLDFAAGYPPGDYDPELVARVEPSLPGRQLVD